MTCFYNLWQINTIFLNLFINKHQRFLHLSNAPKACCYNFVCVHFMYSSYLCEKCHKNVFLFCHLEKKPKQNDLCSIIKGCSGVFFIWADYYFFRTGKIFHLSGKLYIVLHLAEIKYIKRVDFGSVTCMVLHQSPMWHKLGHCYWQNLNIYCLQAYLTSEKILIEEVILFCLFFQMAK
jgi:hypothetical protein